MADLSGAFNPAAVATSSDAASDALSKIAGVSDAASDALSKAYSRIATVSDAASDALSKAYSRCATISDAASKAKAQAASVASVASDAKSAASDCLSKIAVVSDAASDALSKVALVSDAASDALSKIGDRTDQSVKSAASPKFATVKCTGLTDGYVPYHVADATGLANSPIFVSGTNVGIGTVLSATPLAVAGTSTDCTNTLDQIFRVDGSATNSIDFGCSITSPYGGWIQARSRTSGSTYYPLYLQVGGSNLGIFASTFGTSANKSITVGTGTAPSGGMPVDAFQMYSADIVGGNAAPHFQTEAGDVIKLYKYVDARIDDTINSGDATTDGVIDAIRDALIAHGLMAAA